MPVWGWAEPGEEVGVSVAGQTRTAMADDKGNWRVMLDPLKAGTAATMTVKGKNTITIKDVLVGEVWLASGQSNMHLNFLQMQREPDHKTALDDCDDPWIRLPACSFRTDNWPVK